MLSSIVLLSLHLTNTFMGSILMGRDYEFARIFLHYCCQTAIPSNGGLFDGVSEKTTRANRTLPQKREFFFGRKEVNI